MGHYACDMRPEWFADKRVMSKEKETIAWECKHCGHRHMWRWSHGDACKGPINMECDKCRLQTKAQLAQIGSSVWAAAWCMF